MRLAIIVEFVNFSEDSCDVVICMILHSVISMVPGSQLSWENHVRVGYDLVTKHQQAISVLEITSIAVSEMFVSSFTSPFPPPLEVYANGVTLGNPLEMGAGGTQEPTLNRGWNFQSHPLISRKDSEAGGGINHQGSMY